MSGFAKVMAVGNLGADPEHANARVDRQERRQALDDGSDRQLGSLPGQQGRRRRDPVLMARYELLDNKGESFSTHRSARSAMAAVAGPRFRPAFWIKIGNHKKKFSYFGYPEQQIKELLSWARWVRHL